MMASHSALIYPDSPYVVPDFEESTIEKLTYYLTVGQKCLNKLRPRHRRDDLTERWNTAQVHWHANPANPSSFPLERLTVAVVNAFYHKCDSICVREPESDDVDECASTIHFAMSDLPLKPFLNWKQADAYIFCCPQRRAVYNPMLAVHPRSSAEIQDKKYSWRPFVSSCRRGF